MNTVTTLSWQLPCHSRIVSEIAVGGARKSPHDRRDGGTGPLWPRQRRNARVHEPVPAPKPHEGAASGGAHALKPRQVEAQYGHDARYVRGMCGFVRVALAHMEQECATTQAEASKALLCVLSVLPARGLVLGSRLYHLTASARCRRSYLVGGTSQRRTYRMASYSQVRVRSTTRWSRWRLGSLCGGAPTGR